jgi:hypothetical protein
MSLTVDCGTLPRDYGDCGTLCGSNWGLWDTAVGLIVDCGTLLWTLLGIVGHCCGSDGDCGTLLWV